MRHKPKCHGQHQGHCRNDPAEKVDKFVTGHDLVITGEPQDHDKEHTSQNNSIYQCFQCNPVSTALDIKQRCHSIMVKHRIQQCDDQKTWNCQEKVDLQDLSHSVQPHGICSSSHKRHCQINRMLDKHGKPQHHGKIKEIQNGMASGEGISHNTDPPHPCQDYRYNAILQYPRLPAYTWNIRNLDTSH